MISQSPFHSVSFVFYRRIPVVSQSRSIGLLVGFLSMDRSPHGLLESAHGLLEREDPTDHLGGSEGRLPVPPKCTASDEHLSSQHVPAPCALCQLQATHVVQV